MPRKRNHIPATGPVFESCTGSITAGVISRIEFRGKRFVLRDDKVQGLFLAIGATTKTWALDYRDRNRKRQTYRIGTPKTYSTGEARKKALKLLGQIAGGHDPALAKRQARLAAQETVGAYLTGPYAELVLSHARAGANTLAAIQATFSHLLNRSMSSLTVAEMERHNADREVSPSTLNRDRGRLQGMLNHAVTAGVLESNPLGRWKAVKVGQHSRVRWLQPGERERFLSALELQPDDIQILIHMALGTGMRRGELFGLQWANLDLRRGQVTVAASTSKGAKTRVIPLNSTLLEQLKEWRGGVLPVPDLLVFPDPKTGTRRNVVRNQWMKLCRQAGIEDFRLHDCRHDFASRLVQAGVDLYRVKDLLGHSSITMTEKYAHLAPEAGAEAVEVLVTKR